MSALYLVTNDMSYYRAIDNIDKFNEVISTTTNKLKGNIELKELQLFDWFESDKYKKIERIILCPSSDDIKAHFLDEKVLFLNWDYPSSELNDLLVVRELPIVSGLLTEQEIEFDVSNRDALAQKLNLEIIETNQGYKDLAGAEIQIDIIEDMFYSFDKKRMSKLTIFLLGIPGAGKTYLAQCIAGEKNRLLIKLDLSKMIEMDRPIQKLHYFFKWLQMLHFQGEHVVVLLDEVAQALSGGNYLQNQFKGQLLTVVEDLNTQSGYQIGNTMIIATDNNIREIMLETPQFLARFEETFFINFPKEKEAKNILKMYLNKYNTKYGRDSLFDEADVNALYINIKDFYHGEKIQYDAKDSRFIYAPREIKKFAVKLATISERYFQNNSEAQYLPYEEIIKCCNRVPPQQKVLKMGISRMINDAGSGFIEI